MEKKSFSGNMKQLVILGLLSAILLVMSYTPLGYLNIGPLAITLNVIPMAIAAVAAGPAGGAIVGGIFGLTSFLQCIGVGGSSAMGVICFEINPFFAFVQRFVPRVLAGFLVGLAFSYLAKRIKPQLACAISGFLAAFLNTVFFMSALVLLYGNTDYLRGLINGRNILVFVCTFVGINAVFEMLASTIVTAGVGSALIHAKLVPLPEKKNRI